MKSVKQNRVLFPVLAALAASPGVVLAQSDNDQTVPTGWTWHLGVSAATIQNLDNQGLRVTDIERTGADSYDAATVVNTGAYAKTGASVYTNVTPASLSSSLTANNQRLIDLEVYDAGGGQIRVSAVAVRNTGADGAGWGWLWGVTAQQINDWVSNANPGIRLIDLDTYIVNGTRYYSAVAINNTGANQQGWWYYYDVSPAFINQQLQANHARLTNIEVHNPGTLFTQATYTCVMVSAGNTKSWWTPAATADQVADMFDLNAARPIDLTEFTDPFGNTRYAVVMIDNANALEGDVRQVYIDALTPGSGATGGGYMKQVGGSILASVGADHTFEPASMLKILYGTYAMDQCAAGLDNLNNMVFVADRCNNNECPDNVPCNPGSETLSAAIREMLEQSDNNRTKVIHDRYGRTTLNNYASSLGMTHTQINHDIGCGLPANHFSLRDAGTIYEKVADGSLFSQQWQDALYDLMLDSNGSQGSFGSYITQEAALTSLTPSEIAAFRTYCYMAIKGGSYGLNGLSYITAGGWMRLPFKVNGNVQIREFVISTFVNDEPDANAAGASGPAWWVMGRDRIRAALASWDAACTPPNITLQPQDRTRCAGQAVTFGVSTQGTSPLTYRWYRNGVMLFDGPGPNGSTIAGATSPALVISNVQAANAANYSVSITNACGNDFSDAATLSIFCCPADFNHSGSVNSQDFFDFITAFFAVSPTADFNEDGMVNSQDYFDFVTAFFTPCR